MKVSGVSNKVQASSSKAKDKIQKSEGFSMSLNLANKEQSEQRLKEMLDDIDKLGKKLTSTRSVGDARAYKLKIQEYLTLIVKNIYVLRREPGPFNYGIHVRIEIINQKLDDLTKDLIKEQKETIDLVNKIEEIRGLLVDVYK
ncbi:MAG: hypothetical protein K0R09_1572 [Clostridiales bacterium]|jgi:uncharacterized protein YaaR (DUF327 family)|nr:hypothetical protein [Clostridiales bacterium]